MASNLFKMRFNDESGVDNYYFDVFIQEYVKTFLPNILESFNYVWDNQTEPEMSYGDADFTLTKLVDTPEKKVLYIADHCSCADITRYLVFYIKTDFEVKFHIRKVWSDKNTDYKKKNQYIHAPNLKWYKDRKFSLEFDEKLHSTPLGGSYGDCRDVGYVLTAKKYCFQGMSMDNDWTVEQGAMKNYSNILFVARELSGAVYELEELKEEE